MLGRRGRGRGGRDYYPRNAPPGGPGYGRGRGRGGRGEGRGQEARVGYGGGRGGRGGYDGAAPPPHRRASIAPRQPPPQQEASSSSTSAAASLIQAMERKLSVRETAEAQASGLATASSPMVAATPGPHDAPQPESSKAMNHPSRPDYGSMGMKVTVRANHFQVRVTNKELCHYDVAITPEATSRSVNRRVISKLVELYGKSHLGNRKPVYDGRKSLYTAGALPFIFEDFVIELIEEKGDIKKEKKYMVAIKLAGRADLHHLDQFFSGGRLNASQETLQVLSVVLRESPSTIYTAVARSFFSPMFEFSSEIGDGLKRRTEIGNGLECWRGYYQSLRPTQLGLSLNVDISATYFYKPVLVTQFVKEYLRLGDQTRALSDQDRVKIKKALSGLRVQATHSCRHYKISGISSLPMNELMFSRDEQGTNVSVVQYFQERYDYPLEYVTWPCLQAGSDSGPTYLPMEVCKIEEGQHFSRKLNTDQVSAILKVTCRRPQQREQTILQIVEQNNYSNDKYAEEFGIHVSDKLVSVTARVLPPPRLKYNASGRYEVYHPENGQWNMTNKKLVNGGTVKNWTCVNFSELGQKEVRRFCDELVRKCCDVGMTFNPKELVDFRSARPDGLESALREVHNLSTETLARNRKGGQHLQLLIVVLPKMGGPYGKIKRLCETELGIVTQCCLPQHVFACKPQYLENVALKINVKVGGRNTVLESALHYRIPLVTDVPTIIFGADVTHPPPGQDSSSSIAAVVASMDWPQVTKYRALVSAQPPRQEMIEDLYTETQDPHTGTVCGGMIRELLIAFQKSMTQKPSRIIFYRDGVSEGQFSQVLQYELAAIRKACLSLLNQRTPVTFVVVQKRHHTRLFPVDVNLHADRSGNIRPGTVVDTQICHPTGFDFYLCSHAGIQGTSRPTHYHVLLDENGFSADRLQTLTNNLCYTYARCTRSVSVVPPAYYAHLAAARARNYVEAEAPEGGSASGGDVNAQQGRAGVRPLPTIKDNVKDVMFYC